MEVVEFLLPTKGSLLICAALVLLLLLALTYGPAGTLTTLLLVVPMIVIYSPVVFLSCGYFLPGSDVSICSPLFPYYSLIYAYLVSRILVTILAKC